MAAQRTLCVWQLGRFCCCFSFVCSLVYLNVHRQSDDMSHRNEGKAEEEEVERENEPRTYYIRAKLCGSMFNLRCRAKGF